MKTRRGILRVCLLSSALAVWLAGGSSGEGLPGLSAPPAQPPDSRPASYECPRTKYIDCMPPVRGEARRLCSPEHLEWIGRNCPDVKVVY